MLHAVIIRGKGFIPCSGECGSLKTYLKYGRTFGGVDEISTATVSSLGEIEPKPDLILLSLPAGDWSAEVAMCEKRWPRVKILALFCGSETQDSEVVASLPAVHDLLFCPFQRRELLIRIERLLEPEPEARTSRGKRNSDGDGLLVGRSEEFLNAVEKTKLLARSRAPVLISGETGSGKELFARAIHYQSVRSFRPFIPVNCGALPDHLFENELFGHRKGAYTNAATAERGLIAESDGGTLFLDELDTLSLAAQVKMLRFLQSGEYRPLGAARSSVADVRIIAATNTDLQRRVKLGLFREDLHYRLNVLSLIIPPLRERAGDVIDLAKHFLAIYAREQGRPTPRLGDDAMAALSNHSWPGNVRELEGSIQRAIILRHREVLTAADFDLPVSTSRFSPADLFRLGKSRAIGEFERTFVARALAANQGNISRAAKAAGKDRRSFQRLINKYALNPRSFESESETQNVECG